MKFVQVFRAENRPLAEKLGIKSSPSILFYKNGQEVCQRLTGYITKPELRKAIEETIGGTCKNPERKRYDCDAIVVGAGPAGLTTAMYLARGKLKTLVIDEGLPGGQASMTHHIANYPGTNGTIMGKDLTGNMVEQAMSFGAEIHDLQEISEIDLHSNPKHIKTEDADYYAPCVILATGAEPRKLPAAGEREYRGRGVHYCATCDGALYQDRNIIVVGGGNSALQEAVYLTRFASRVTVVHQFDKFQASQVAQDELSKNPNIDVIWNAEVQKVEGDTSVKGIIIKDRNSSETRAVAADGVFVYIGTQPRTGLFQNQIKLNDDGYIVTDPELKTTVDGVFAAGDVREKKVRQVATAVGDGAVAGLMAEKLLASILS
jgi:thioredoxin reductase (NADPH)